MLGALKSVYRRHLSRYRWAQRARNLFVRAIIWTHFWLFPVVMMLFTGSDRRYRLLALPSAGPDLVRCRTMLHERETVALSWPAVWQRGRRVPAQGNGGPVVYEWPAIERFQIRHARVAGRSEFVFAGGSALHHPLFDAQAHATGEELHRLGAFNPARSRYFRRRLEHAPVQLDAAIALVGSCTANYVHWLTETLPQLLLADRAPALARLPVVVDAGLHPNILASMTAFAPSRSDRVELAPGQVAEIGELFVCCAPTFIPFDYRVRMFGKRPELVGRTDAARFSPFALRLVRERADALFSEPAAPRRRLLLRRRSNMRSVVNFEELEAALQSEGFEVVEPEALPFLEQVSLFRTAAVVVAQTGAGLGNLLFAPHGCRVVTLIGRSPFSNYHYYSNLAQIAGLDLVYVEGQPVDLSVWHPAHADYRIDAADVLGAVRAAEPAGPS
ncbi:MAG: hypothetical protein A2Z64_12260 [Betaproteobacteria bacterium RIFCSPLOWO2_02_67_12]|nr:MAG: hypothetical protein A2Z64_12260 [Betaproteobacteria bacterium RIFCSPLOWO2_02_67_12]